MNGVDTINNRLRQLVRFSFGKRYFFQNNKKFDQSLTKNDTIHMYLAFLYKKPYYKPIENC